jgi:hypothetical protein
MGQPCEFQVTGGARLALRWACAAVNTTGCRDGQGPGQPGKPGCDPNASSALGLSQTQRCTSAEFALADGAELTVATAVITHGECEGCNPDAEGAAAAALDLVKNVNTPALLSSHYEWWDAYWRTGAQVDLGPNHTNLEEFYYGCHYLIGSAARAGKNAPALDGPFETSATGDEMFVLNYNFQAPYYSVFADNRPELAVPSFHTVENFIELGKWRASMKYWGAGGHPEAPGFWTQVRQQSSVLMACLSLRCHRVVHGWLTPRPLPAGF